MKYGSVIFESAKYGYKPERVRRLLALSKGAQVIVPGSLMAYLQTYSPKRGPYRPSGGGKSKRKPH